MWATGFELYAYCHLWWHNVAQHFPGLLCICATYLLEVLLSILDHPPFGQAAIASLGSLLMIRAMAVFLFLTPSLGLVTM